jgi:hypothetical protein
VDGETELFEIVLALHSIGGLARLLDGRQQQSDQDGNDGNYHQQLNECETSPLGADEFGDDDHG